MNPSHYIFLTDTADFVLENLEYIFQEGVGNASVCAVSTSELGKNINITVSFIDSTAISKKGVVDQWFGRREDYHIRLIFRGYFILRNQAKGGFTKFSQFLISRMDIDSRNTRN